MRSRNIGGALFPMSGNPNYRRGRNLEYLVKKKLELQGYFVSRSAGSHSVDLIAIKSNETYPMHDILFVSCKVSGYVPPVEKADFMELAHKFGAIPMLTRRDAQRRWELVPLH
jgi:Holliday junction resolvase